MSFGAILELHASFTYAAQRRDWSKAFYFSFASKVAFLDFVHSPSFASVLTLAPHDVWRSALPGKLDFCPVQLPDL